MPRANESIASRFPVLFSYGQERHIFLSNEEAAAATLDERIASVWPYLVRKVFVFARFLKPRERVNFDVDDTVNEIWIALAERDGQWDQTKGRYITFAALVINNVLCSIRDKARTVEAPRNSSCRIKAYRALEEAGTLTDQQRKTYADILRTGENSVKLNAGDMVEPWAEASQLSVLADKDEADEQIRALRMAMQGLTEIEANVLTRFFCLGGIERTSVRQLSAEWGVEEANIRRAKDRAVLKVRTYLKDIGHPAVQVA